MGSLFTKTKVPPLNVVTLPTYCIPTKESNNLEAKREAQLEWMRQRGMAYLGDPSKQASLQQAEKKPRRRLTITPVRLVRVCSGGGAEDARFPDDAAQEG